PDVFSSALDRRTTIRSPTGLSRMVASPWSIAGCTPSLGEWLWQRLKASSVPAKAVDVICILKMTCGDPVQLVNALPLSRMSDWTGVACRIGRRVEPEQRIGLANRRPSMQTWEHPRRYFGHRMSLMNASRIALAVGLTLGFLALASAQDKKEPA